MVVSKIFLFSSRTLGKWSNLTVAYFSDRLVQPPSSHDVEDFAAEKPPLLKELHGQLPRLLEDFIRWVRHPFHRITEGEDSTRWKKTSQDEYTTIMIWKFPPILKPQQHHFHPTPRRYLLCVFLSTRFQRHGIKSPRSSSLLAQGVVLNDFMGWSNLIANWAMGDCLEGIPEKW